MVVDLHLRADGSRAEYDLYIGRCVRFHPVFTDASKWANPFGRGPDSLQRYEQRVRNGPLWDALPELEGKRLGCWCVNTDSTEPPLHCHGQVLMRLLRERKAQLVTRSCTCPHCGQEYTFPTPLEGNEWAEFVCEGCGNTVYVVNEVTVP